MHRCAGDKGQQKRDRDGEIALRHPWCLSRSLDQDKVLKALWLDVSQVLAENDRVDKLVVSLEQRGLWDQADPVELEVVPDLPGGDVGHEDQVVHGVLVAQERRPLEVHLAESVADLLAAVGRVDEEARVAVVGAAGHVVGLDVEGAEDQWGPVLRSRDVVGDRERGGLQEDDAEGVEPVVDKLIAGQRLVLWVGVATLDLAVELAVQKVDQRGGDLGVVEHREGSGDGLRVLQLALQGLDLVNEWLEESWAVVQRSSRVR
ncbi:hypothetical protein DAKH74_052490 [Maudiozyma humilis]|uniref:Uncharacterized protein n=1 Tax=Maudiozyma humilis TaxID=51915 RepID=A0AAV5S618_MAUHU|nr:hypothetical protein DAKH74_052490 [Kazachstania humilis]